MFVVERDRTSHEKLDIPEILVTVDLYIVKTFLLSADISFAYCA